MLKNKRRLFIALISLGLLVFTGVPVSAQVQNPKSGSVGLEGTIASPPPSRGATITVPSNGQSFTQLPITVRGLCPDNVLVKLFKNNVFGGSAQCTNGSYSIITDLFSGKNELVARVYDDLDQAGPDSNLVTVTFNDANFAVFGPHLSLTSEFAKKGANPNENLAWPITLSGGQGPYAISVDWGDGTQPDLSSQQFPGIITLNHKYASPGIYNILIKATDKNGATAYLQLVGIANGKSSQQAAGTDNTKTATIVKVLWWPAAVAIPLIASTFWLGKRHELYILRKRIEKQQSQ
jgi:hypothetical protein